MCGLFLYRTSSPFLIESASLWFALVIMEEMALWQREGMSSSRGVLSSRRTSEAMACIVVVSVGGEVWGIFGVRVGLIWLVAEFRNRVMRLICLLSDLLIGVYNL